MCQIVELLLERFIVVQVIVVERTAHGEYATNLAGCRERYEVDVFHLDSFEAKMRKGKHINGQVDPAVALENARRYPCMELVDDDVLRLRARVEHKPPFMLIGVCDSDFNLELVSALGRNVNLKNHEWLLQGQAVLLLGRHLQLGRGAIDGVHCALHGLVEDLLDIFGAAFNLEYLQRIFTSGREHFDRRPIVVGMPEH